MVDLSKKRALQQEELDVEVVLIDVTECEIERQKNKKNGIQEKEKTYNKNINNRRCKK